MHTTATQRLRIAYAISGPLRYLSVLDMGRLWERLLRRAGLPLAYTQGFNPHPRMAFGTPLPVGYSSEMEFLDVLLGATTPLDKASERIEPHCPAGLSLRGVREVPIDAPSLQGAMRTADYAIAIWSPASVDEAQTALGLVLASDVLPRERTRTGKTIAYDLRPLLVSATWVGHDVAPDRATSIHHLEATMQCSPQGVGRPEELVDQLSLSATHWAICRTALHWQGEEE